MIATQTSNNPSTGVKHLDLQSYRPDFRPECCTANVQRMIPNYVARMWMSDAHDGLAATLYGPSCVTWKMGQEATSVTIEQKTDYPFNGKITITVRTGRRVEFPLSFRLPAWANGTTVSVYGDTAEPARANTFYQVRRNFTDGDTIVVDAGQPVELRIRLQRRG